MTPSSTSSRARKLAEDAAEAAELRAYQTHPDVVALRIEWVRLQVERMCWCGIVLGLTFTMINVQAFASAGARPWSLPWLTAWLLDPTVSLVLLAILRAEQVTARYQVRTGPWVRRAKWFTLAATYVMNTWASYAEGSPSAVVLTRCRRWWCSWRSRRSPICATSSPRRSPSRTPRRSPPFMNTASYGATGRTANTAAQAARGVRRRGSRGLVAGCCDHTSLGASGDRVLTRPVLQGGQGACCRAGAGRGWP